ncbi:hypothetical protein [uncultured Oscillibacter sp.]|uniref:hypothetical protein n=1 Tax=uncultured Oscillibacter sp. TaxID=876091 RepID=UPI002622DF3A|nr:hypothetical protein [uncultured Oscillibacter sp.]
MAKNPNGKSMKRDNSLYGATLFFLAACLAEFYLLVLRKYYIHGDVVTEALVWYDRLLIFAGLGAAVLLVGVILSVLWKADERKRLFGWALSALGAFFAVGSMLARIYVEPAVTLLSVVVPVLMVLTVIWAFYDRECSVALTALCGTMILLWVCRRLFNSLTMGVPVKVLSVVYVLLLAGVCWLAKNKKLGRLLPVGADLMPIYAATGLSAVAVVLALFSATVAYYAMWVLGVVVFALAVYYTVKQL